MASNARKLRRALEQGKHPGKLKLITRNPYDRTPGGLGVNTHTKSTFYAISKRKGGEA